MGSTRRAYTDEYKAHAVAFVINDGRPIVEVARNIGVHEITLGKWVKKAKASSESASAPLEDSERAELERLRVENERDASRTDQALEQLAIVHTTSINRFGPDSQLATRIRDLIASLETR
jgi:transposase